MTGAQLWERDAWELADAVRRGDQSARELLELSLDRVAGLDGALNAVCHLDADAARAQADAVDRRVAAGDDPGTFAGIPMGVKELAEVEGWPETHASLPYRDQVAQWDCVEVARLRAAGAVITAQTTSPEHGTVSFTNSKLHGVTRNPWNVEHTPGGSSGGSAAAVAAGDDPGTFAGIPMGVKELAEVEGWPETHASLPYRDQVAQWDCVEVARLRAAGAVITAQTTSPEHGTVSFTNSKLHGATRNPWNVERTPGGSSGGSAAAVAAGIFPACTGSDGGGSIRIPCSYSGLFGMKSTLGLLGTGPGPGPYPSLTSVHGPIVRSVRDAARYLDATAGPTLTDLLSLPKPQVPFEELLTSGEAVEQLRGKRAAWSATVGYGGTDPEVEKRAYEAAIALVDLAGLELVDVSVDLPKPGVSWGILSSLETAAWHLDHVRDRLDELDEVHRSGMEMMANLRGSGVFKAIRRRHELMAATARVFSEVDILLTPTTPTTAFAAEGTLTGEVAGRKVSLMLLSAAFTAPFNMTGQPAASIPAGLVDGLPCALQVVARRHEDELCLAAGALLEEARPWPKLAPYAYGKSCPRGQVACGL